MLLHEGPAHIFALYSLIAQVICLVGWSRDGLQPVVSGTMGRSHLISAGISVVWLRS